MGIFYAFANRQQGTIFANLYGVRSLDDKHLGTFHI